ncbi:hypothetical protein TOK_3544 [Pseudonocardia sp. N23]|nr:hypothetical protein TOK_3544 [Pseudonocardia sp. N23]
MPARAGAPVSTADVVTNVLGGLVALALLVYLTVALLRPEKF